MGNTKSVINNAVVKILRPLIRILMRYGLSCPEFMEIAKKLYVEIAESDFGINGKKQTISRIATLTGLSRKDTQKTKLKLEQADEINTAPVNRANRVILGWLKDSEFLDKNRKPVVIPIRGDQVSFEKLVKRYSGDIPMNAILDELKRIGAVEEIEGAQLRLLTKGYIPKTEEEKIDVMAKCLSDQLKTIEFNLTHPSYEARFQRQIKYVDLTPEVIKEFKEYSKQRSIELMTEFNLWLSDRKKSIRMTKDSEEKGVVGFGLYYFEEEDRESQKKIDN